MSGGLCSGFHDASLESLKASRWFCWRSLGSEMKVLVKRRHGESGFSEPLFRISSRINF